jgi:hypothetical protein
VTNRIPVDRLCGLTEPVKGRPASVVERLYIGALVDQNTDRLHKSRLDHIVQRGGPVVALVDPCPIPEKRGDE